MGQGRQQNWSGHGHDDHDVTFSMIPAKQLLAILLRLRVGESGQLNS